MELPLIFAQQLASAERRARATAILNQIGLGDHLRHRPVQMSAGQRLRVAVSRRWSIALAFFWPMNRPPPWIPPMRQP
ncbi:MAG: hypothetical protein R2911_09875 [Caldilineaceae bacterium]